MIKDKNDIGDDSMWHKLRAVIVIDSVGIEKITPTRQFIRLKGQHQTWDLDVGKKDLPTKNLIFFKTTKEPTIISTVNLTTKEVKEYFER